MNAEVTVDRGLEGAFVDAVGPAAACGCQDGTTSNYTQQLLNLHIKFLLNRLDANNERAFVRAAIFDRATPSGYPDRGRKIEREILRGISESF
jgi:hypothetical protein